MERETVEEILVSWLRERGYDGLYHDSDCGCVIGDLIPCGECFNECKPGYRVSSDLIEGNGRTFMVMKEKPEANSALPSEEWMKLYLKRFRSGDPLRAWYDGHDLEEILYEFVLGALKPNNEFAYTEWVSTIKDKPMEIVRIGKKEEKNEKE